MRISISHLHQIFRAQLQLDKTSYVRFMMLSSLGVFHPVGVHPILLQQPFYTYPHKTQMDELSG